MMVSVSQSSKTRENIKLMVSDIADIVIADTGVCITKTLSMRKLRSYGVEQR
jgi:hypothetical protein